MRTFESRKTPNLSGVTAACAAALAVFALAACSYPSAPGAAQGVDPAAIFQDAAGLVRVSIPLPTGGGSDPVNSISRSVSTTGIQLAVDFYEVVFRTINPSTSAPLPTRVKPYYKGTANKEDSYITASVIPGYAYDILLLAGSTDYQGKTLLAAGYRAGKYDTDPANHVNYITAGINNVFTINMAPVTPQWNTSANAITSGGATDFAFSAASTSSGGYNITVSLGNRYVHISPGTEAEPDSGESDNAKKPIPSSSAVFTVKYGLSKLAPLLAAEKSTDSTPTDSGAVTFANRRVRIKALDNKDTKYFAAIKLDAATGTSSGDNILHTSGKFTLPTSSVTAPYIAFFNSPSGTTDNLPGNNKDGHLLFELDYYAFGTKDSGGELWTIRNGLNSNEDYASLNATDLTGDTDGGAIHLVFGAGDPDEVEYKTVQLKNPSQE